MTITAIERQKHDEKRYSVFIDGGFAFGMSGTDILYYKLEPGAELSPARYEFLINEVLFAKAKERALRYLGHRARTRRELAERLADYPEEVTEKVFAMLEAYGYLDDLAFAREYVRSRARSKGYGALRLRKELRERGVAADVAAAALAESEFDEAGSALAKLQRKASGALDASDKKKYYGYLARQGFGHDVIMQAFREYEEGQS